MNNHIKKYFFLCITLWNLSCAGFSATYFYQLYLHNEYYAEPPGFPSKFILSPIISSFSGQADQWHEERFAAGLIETVRLAYNHTWIEFITAFGKEHIQLNQQGIITKKSRFGMDDFLIDIGHNFLDESGKKQLLLHWLTGIPLTKKVSLADVNQPLWGTRTYATGPVIEVVYEFVRNKAEDIFIGVITRFLHGFRTRYTPILPLDAFFNPGNSLDILALFHYRYYDQNIEAGYVFTKFSNSSYEFSDHIEHLPSQRYNSFYLDYFYFYKPRSMGFEINITKTIGTPYNGITVYGLITWYF